MSCEESGVQEHSSVMADYEQGEGAVRPHSLQALGHLTLSEKTQPYWERPQKKTPLHSDLERSQRTMARWNKPQLTYWNRAV